MNHKALGSSFMFPCNSKNQDKTRRLNSVFFLLADLHPVSDFAYGGLRKRGNYGFPHSVKYVAWFIVVAITVASNAVVIAHGLLFGTIQTYFWITAVVTFLCVNFFELEPVRIFALAMIDSVFLKSKPTVTKRIILPSLLLNPPDPARKKRMLKHRHYNANLYNPMPFYKQQSRLEDIKYNLELRNLTIDMYVYLILIMMALYIVSINKPSMSFYSNQMVLELISKGAQKDSVNFREISSYEMLLKYINETLLPALLPNSVPNYNMQDKKSGETFRRKKGTRQNHVRHLRPPSHNTRKRHVIDGFNIHGANYEERENSFVRGWTLNPNLKLLGKPRLRQTRVKTDTCKELKNFKARNVECASELTLFNIETGEFSLDWGPPPPEGLTELQASPWSYQSAWETVTLPIFARFSTYPGGGYILELARNIDDARIVLEFLDDFHWVDFRTRAIFIEFTIYCANTNLFSIVTLIAEKSATGYVISSYQIDTCKFLFSLDVQTLFISVVSSWFLFKLFFNKTLRTSKTAINQYLRRALGSLDLVIIFLQILSLILTIAKNVYVFYLLTELKKTDNNKSVSFRYAAFWNSFFLKIEALLVCLIFFKIFHLLTHRVVFFQLRNIISQSGKHFINLIAHKIIFIIALALLFSCIQKYSEDFRNFDTSYFAVLERAATFNEDFELNDYPWASAPLCFGLFVLFISILLVNMFLAVINLYFRKIWNISLLEKYDFFEYVRYLLTKSRQKDLFHQKDEKIFLKRDVDVMRLKGGGNKPTKNKYKKGKKKKKAGLKMEVESGSMAVTVENFISEKPYDTTKYFDMTESRALAIKSMMTWFLMDEESIKAIAKENAMKALFLSLVSDKVQLNEDSRKYFFVSDKSEIKVCDKNTILKMRKTVENMGKEKRWLVDERLCDEEVNRKETSLAILERKLSQLICLLDNK